jgi:hypothetical protein
MVFLKDCSVNPGKICSSSEQFLIKMFLESDHLISAVDLVGLRSLIPPFQNLPKSSHANYSKCSELLIVIADIHSEEPLKD